MSRKTNLLRKRARQWEERRKRLSDRESALAEGFRHAGELYAKAGDQQAYAKKAIEELQSRMLLSISAPERMPQDSQMMGIQIVFYPAKMRYAMYRGSAGQAVDIDGYALRIADEAKYKIAKAIKDFMAEKI